MTRFVLTAALFALPLVAAPAQRPQPVKAPPAKADKEGKLFFWIDARPVLLKPDGTVDDSDDAPTAEAEVGWSRVVRSPDDKWLAVQKRGAAMKPPPAKDGEQPLPFPSERDTLHVLACRPAEDAKPVTLKGVHLGDFRWLDGGKTLHVVGHEIDTDDVVSEHARNWLWEPATDKRTPLKLPDSFHIRALSPDGKTAVLDEWKMDDKTWHQRAHLWDIGSDEKPTPLFDLNQGFDNLRPRFSPDGRQLLCTLSHYATYTPAGNGGFHTSDFKFNHLLVVDLKTKKQTVLKELGEKPLWRVSGLAWSPDGKRVAYVEANTRMTAPPDGKRLIRVVVADADGTNEKEVYTTLGSRLVGFDWR